MLILADALVSTPDCVLRPGRLRISGRTIQEVGSDLRALPGEEVLELPGLTLAPGFLNLHTHLELSPLHGKVAPRLPFAEWLRQILALLPGLHATARTTSILETSRSAAESGTTTILTILSDPRSLAGLAGTLPRIWWALEFMDLHGDPQAEKQMERLAAWLSRHPGCDWRAAISPHAPYSASSNLYRECAHLASALHFPFTTHWAESTEEAQLFQSGGGALRPLLPDGWISGSLSDRFDALPTGSLIAHGNGLGQDDLQRLQARGCFVVHCPTSHAWFGRELFPLEKFRRSKLPVILGTDSPASSDNRSLDLRVEARAFHQAHPHVSWSGIWSMLTTLPAEALGQADRLGSLTPGAQADWVAWRLPPTPAPFPHPTPHPPATPIALVDASIPAILNSTDPAEIVSVAGRLHRPDKI
jgi:cytosine/adenosine deaminase-related metal-dependent hydrolase